MAPKYKTATCTSFVTANDQRIQFSRKAISVAKSKMKDIEGDVVNKEPEDIINEFVAIKRKRLDDEAHTKKKPKQSTSTDTSVTSTTHDSCLSSKDDDIDWSDCDELELSRVIIEKSFVEQKTDDHQNSNAISDESREHNKQQASTPTSDFLSNDDVDDVDWSDCDELEMSRTISLIDQPINDSTVKQDRSVLQEISNFSDLDQSL